MFDGVIAQLRPMAVHCGVQFERLMLQLKNIEGSIREGSAESEFGDRVIRVAGTLPAASPSQSLGVVPLDQLWVLDYVWSDTAGWTLTLGGIPRFGPTNVSFVQRVLMLPGEEWSFTPPAGAVTYAVQLTRQFLAERPRRASTGSGAPEGMTSAQGPPVHELTRDALHLVART